MNGQSRAFELMRTEGQARLAQAFRDGVRWRESQANNGIVHDRYIEVNNPYTTEGDTND